MLSKAKHPLKRTNIANCLGKQTGLLCFGDLSVDAHPGILPFGQNDNGWFGKEATAIDAKGLLTSALLGAQLRKLKSPIWAANFVAFTTPTSVTISD